MRYTILALCATALLTACATYRDSDEPGFVRLNEPARVGAHEVIPLAILEDSRCPRDVQCIWAGRVRIAARVDGEQRQMTLGEPVKLAAGGLELSEVRPARIANEPIRPDSYQFRFVLAGTP